MGLVFFLCLAFRSFVGVCFTAVLLLIGYGNSAGLPLSWTLGASLFCLGVCAGQAKSRDFPYWQVPLGTFGLLVLSSGALALTCRPLSFQMSCTVCPTNLKNIATALELYREDNGDLPESLSALNPDYLVKIPTCLPAEPNRLGEFLYGFQGFTFGPYRYERKESGDYLLSCPSGAHPSTPPGYPRYDGTEGLIDRPR